MEAYVPAVVKSYKIFILPWTENGDGGVGNVIIPHGVPTTLTTLTTFNETTQEIPYPFRVGVVHNINILKLKRYGKRKTFANWFIIHTNPSTYFYRIEINRLHYLELVMGIEPPMDSRGFHTWFVCCGICGGICGRFHSNLI